MRYFATLIVIIAVILQFFNCNGLNARIESCASCQLNRLPEVKKFIYEDIPKYENVDFKRIPGASPELVLTGDNDEELERISLAPFNREECNNILKEKGFEMTDDDDDDDGSRHEL